MKVDLRKIKRIREEKGISAKDMAEELGYKHYQSYWRIENGKRGIKIEHLIKLSKILGVPLEDLIKEEEK
ncbi:MAG: transcriptional regulator [Dictyoglomus sp. NZ13-RE01]|nr:MAG: transcriptional regulator [Dictyoglomus sp. NZ13-RE01]